MTKQVRAPIISDLKDAVSVACADLSNLTKAGLLAGAPLPNLAVHDSAQIRTGNSLRMWLLGTAKDGKDAIMQKQSDMQPVGRPCQP